jgi:hypothetical protein
MKLSSSGDAYFPFDYEKYCLKKDNNVSDIDSPILNKKSAPNSPKLQKLYLNESK